MRGPLKKKRHWYPRASRKVPKSSNLYIEKDSSCLLMKNQKILKKFVLVILWMDSGTLTPRLTKHIPNTTLILGHYLSPWRYPSPFLAWRQRGRKDQARSTIDSQWKGGYALKHIKVIMPFCGGLVLEPLSQSDFYVFFHLPFCSNGRIGPQYFYFNLWYVIFLNECMVNLCFFIDVF